MTSYNAANERMKRQYFAYLAEAQGHSEQTIDAVAKAIARFEAYTRYKDFKAFYDRLLILRREKSGGMEDILLAMATGYDYRKYQKSKPSK